MKDQKGYEYRPMDWQDVIVLAGCVITALALFAIWGWL